MLILKARHYEGVSCQCMSPGLKVPNLRIYPFAFQTGPLCLCSLSCLWVVAILKDLVPYCVSSSYFSQYDLFIKLLSVEDLLYQAEVIFTLSCITCSNYYLVTMGQGKFRILLHYLPLSLPHTKYFLTHYLTVSSKYPQDIDVNILS